VEQESKFGDDGPHSRATSRLQATQKGDPVAVLKRQLEEKEKQLTAEQEDAAAARNKLRELSKVSTVQPAQHHGGLPHFDKASRPQAS